VFKNLLIGVAIFGLGWGAAFAAGMAWGRRSVLPPAQAQVIPVSQFIPGAQGQGQGAQGQGAQGQGAQGQGRGAAGTIDRVDGKTLYLSEPNGQQVKVNLTDQTQIMKQDAGTVADLTSGSRVLVASQGQPAADGTLTAATVSVFPPGATFPFGGGQGQGGQGRQGAQGQGAQGQGRQGGQGD
jgi:hypothetical protein